MPKKITPAASASTVVRGFADRIAPAMRNLNAAGRSFTNASGSLATRVTEAFVAVLAADHGLNASDASKVVADRCAFTKEAGAPSTNRTWNKAFFDDAANLTALRRSIANPEAMTPGDFQSAVVAYAATINPRASYEATAKAKKDADKASKAALKAEQARQAARDTDAAAETGLPPAVEVIPDTAPALQTRIAADIATLATLDGGPDALATLAAMIADILTPAVTEPLRATG